MALPTLNQIAFISVLFYLFIFYSITLVYYIYIYTYYYYHYIYFICNRTVCKYYLYIERYRFIARCKLLLAQEFSLRSWFSLFLFLRSFIYHSFLINFFFHTNGSTVHSSLLTCVRQCMCECVHTSVLLAHLKPE